MLITEGLGLWEEMDVKTNHHINMQSVQVMKILKLGKQSYMLFTEVQFFCSKSIKKCTAVINTKSRVVLTNGELGRGIELGWSAQGTSSLLYIIPQAGWLALEIVLLFFTNFLYILKLAQ